MVGKYLTLNMVILMLNYASRIAVKLVIVLHEILVKVAHTNLYGARYILVNAWKRQTTLLKQICLLAALINLWIDKHAAEGC